MLNPSLIARRSLLALALLSCLANSRAEPLPELIARAKPSVLLVGTFGALDSPRFSFRGTGFAVGDGNLAITGAHVLPGDEALRGERRLSVMLYGADGQWAPREARVVASDAVATRAITRSNGESEITKCLAQHHAIIFRPRL